MVESPIPQHSDITVKPQTRRANMQIIVGASARMATPIAKHVGPNGEATAVTRSGCGLRICMTRPFFWGGHSRLYNSFPLLAHTYSAPANKHDTQNFVLVVEKDSAQ